ncbi:hypothetical protein [Streptomyces ardesiacus]|uniref:hypothetical protein n=1 Tax=Streptomyces ardesiacus TaxID=285564 RepID=UPI0034076571
MTDPRRLSAVDLLVWSVVLGYREQQKRAGMRALLLPLPPCPACNATVLEGTASWVREAGREEVTISMQPCGHRHWASLRAIEDVQDHVVAMHDILEHRMMTTDEIAREAHARLDQSATIEETGPGECPPGVHSIFDPCPGDCGKPVDDEPDLAQLQRHAQDVSRSTGLAVTVEPFHDQYQIRLEHPGGTASHGGYDSRETHAMLLGIGMAATANTAIVQAAARAEGTDTATWTVVRAIQLMNEAGQQRDEARAAIERVGGLADRLDEFAENALRVDDQKLYAAIASDIRTRINGAAAGPSALSSPDA